MSLKSRQFAGVLENALSSKCSRITTITGLLKRPKEEERRDKGRAPITAGAAGAWRTRPSVMEILSGLGGQAADLRSS